MTNELAEVVTTHFMKHLLRSGVVAKIHQKRDLVTAQNTMTMQPSLEMTKMVQLKPLKKLIQL